MMNIRGNIVLSSNNKLFHLQPLKHISLFCHSTITTTIRGNNFSSLLTYIKVASRLQCRTSKKNYLFFSRTLNTATAKYCPGCGAAFQWFKPNSPGYLPEPVYERHKDLLKESTQQRIKYLQAIPILKQDELNFLLKTTKNKPLICKRCHDAKYKHMITPYRFPDVGRLFSGVKVSPHGIIVHVLDATDFPASSIENLPSLVGNKRIIVAVNKWDLMPKLISPKKAIQYFKQQLNALGWDRIDDLFLISAKNGDNIFELIEAINQRGAQDDVYLFGRANAGKSELINAIFKAASVDSWTPPTTSKVPGTTIDLLRIPLSTFGALFEPKPSNLAKASLNSGLQNKSDKSSDWTEFGLIDTPGIKNDNQLTYLLEPKEINLVMPKKELNFVGTKSFAPGSSFQLGQLARIDYIKGQEPLMITFSGSKGVELAFRKSTKMKRLAPPLHDRATPFPQLELSRELVLNFKGEKLNNKQTTESKDIAFGGLGWVSVNCKYPTESVFHIYTPKKIPITVRSSLYHLDSSMIKDIQRN